jgi:hypothetical protein
LVIPAVDGHPVDVDVDVLLAEFFHSELRDAGLSGASGTCDQCGVGRLGTREWLEDVREVVHLGVAVNHLARDEPGPEEASVLDPIRKLVRSDGKRTWVVF